MGMCDGTEAAPESAGEHPKSDRRRVAWDPSVSDENGKTDEPTTEAAEEVAGATLDLEFMCAEDVIYHQARRGFLLCMHRWCMFGAILFGTAAASAAMNPVLAGILVAAVSAADLCFDFSTRAQAHADLGRRYHSIARRLLSGSDPKLLTKRYFDVSADELPRYPTARLVAHKEATLALGRDQSRLEAIAPWRRFLRHFVQV